jgi:hypothetical protein
MFSLILKHIQSVYRRLLSLFSAGCCLLVDFFVVVSFGFNFCSDFGCFAIFFLKIRFDFWGLLPIQIIHYKF